MNILSDINLYIILHMTEYWTEDSNWKFRPLEPGYMTDPRLDKIFDKYAAKTKITCPGYYRGYVYGYKDEKFLRKPVPKLDILLELYDVIDRYYNEYLGIPTSKAASLFTTFIFDIRQTQSQFPNEKTFSKYTKEKMVIIIKGIKRLKCIPKTEVPVMERLNEILQLLVQ